MPYVSKNERILSQKQSRAQPEAKEHIDMMQQSPKPPCQQKFNNQQAKKLNNGTKKGGQREQNHRFPSLDKVKPNLKF